MGWLYVGINQQTGEKAAVKVISRHMENDYLTRFKLEARAGLLLNHPNIVRTLKLGETDEILYVAMELVEGISLQELIVRQGSIPWPQACSLIAQAAAGLQHAHEKGMVHRDIKPGNLLVKKNGTVKVLDFGLALMEKDEDEFTLAMISGQGCVGTADYISPEQTHRQFRGRSAGRHLQPGLHAVLRADGDGARSPANRWPRSCVPTGQRTPAPFGSSNPRFPAAVEQIVAKMMARKPEDRYRDGGRRRRGASAARPPRLRLLRLFARSSRSARKKPGNASTCSASRLLREDGSAGASPFRTSRAWASTIPRKRRCCRSASTSRSASAGSRGTVPAIGSPW